MTNRYLKIAWKQLFRSGGLNLINILGLSIGISACLAIWVIIRFESSYDDFHPDKDRIYRLESDFHFKSGEIRRPGTVPMPMVGEARKELTGIESIAAFYNYNAAVTIPTPSGESKQFPKMPHGQNNDDLVFAEPEYFSIFHYQWVVGNPAAALSQPFQVVLSTTEAFKYFATTDWESLIGKQVIYDDSLKTTVTGIIEPLKGNTDLTFKDFISYRTINSSYLRSGMEPNNWGRFMSSLQVFVKLKKETSKAHFETQLQVFADHHYQIESNVTYTAALQPLTDLHYNDNPGKDYGRQASLPTLYGLLAIAGIILIIAAINFINLSLAQSLQRVKEVGIRKILGSSRAGLILQFLTETFLKTALALLISMLIVKPVLASFPAFIPNGVSLNYWHPATLFFIIALLAATTMISGFYPGWVLSSFQPAAALKGNTGIKGGSRDNFRKTLIVFQFSISLVFIIASIIIGDQLHFMLKKNMGFNQDAVITLNPGHGDSLVKRQLIVQRLRTVTGVARVSLDDQPPATRGAHQISCTLDGQPPVDIGANIREVDENYLPLYDIKLIAGRNFFPADSSHSAIINQTAAKMLGFQHAEESIGRILTMDGRYTIIGVVADFNIQPLTRSIGPLVIRSNPGEQNAYSIKLRTKGKNLADFTNALAGIERIWREAWPNKPFVYNFYDDAIAEFYQKEQKMAQLINLGMTIAVFLSCIGLFALAALTAERRKKAIGIRKIMGATETGLVYLIVKDFLKLVLLSFIIASPLAWWFTHNWLLNYTYRVPITAWTFALACLTSMLIASLTVSFHVIRTAMSNPTKVLRIEQ
jgi:putative ABC transport system permease protein